MKLLLAQAAIENSIIDTLLGGGRDMIAYVRDLAREGGSTTLIFLGVVVAVFFGYWRFTRGD